MHSPLIQDQILTVERELESGTGPFMPVDVAMTRLCEAAVRAALGEGEHRAMITCAAARSVCERALRHRGTSPADMQRLADQTVEVITAKLQQA